ncbi:MAG TPA: DUF58 domain-containing protein [Candidatus Nitrosopolaris sp.]|nr:DUF58 domain-containing protein [Candidatus Nitrosopolaris sp.]
MNASVVPRWRPAPRARRFASVAVFALAVAFVLGRGGLLAFAAGPLVLLVLGARARPPGRLTLSATLDASRCLEGDPVTVTLTVDADRPVDAVTAEVAGPPSIGTAPLVRDGAGTLSTTIVPGRWGVLSLTMRVTVVATLRLRQTDVDVNLGALTVLPRAPRLRATPAQQALLARLGEHASRVPGSGIEFAGIRDYAPGDVLRDLNWSATSRRHRPLVNERSTERAADLVVAIDGFTELASAEESTVDVAVRGATALTQVALRQRDRVGLIVLGGVLRWLTPASGERQFYRISEAVLAARSVMFSVVRPDVTRLPRPALPPGALVVVFSPLVDERAFAVIQDLRQRRARIVVVDVLRAPPPATHRRGGLDPLAARVWRLDRAADRLALARLGVPVLSWPPGAELQVVLAPLARRPSGSPA